MDEELKRYLDAMEDRMMARINDSTEHILGEIRNLRAEHTVTRQWVFELPGALLAAGKGGIPS